MSQPQVSRFLIPFGSIFLAIGIGSAVITARTLLKAEAMLSWRETPATVIACSLRQTRGSKGSLTYRTEATYDYTVNGNRYTGSRVSLHSGSDNIGSFHQRTYSLLDACRKQGRETRCWVNPDNPSDSILFRKPRPELILFSQLFTFAFGGAGLAVVCTGLFLLLKRARTIADDGLIRMRGTASHRIAAAVALLWNGYAGWLLWVLWRVLSPDPIPWHLWSLAAVGLLLAGMAGYLVGRFRKFGISTFALSPAPGRIGGQVTGMIRIPAPFESQAGFDLRLQCFHRYTTQSGGKSTTRTETLWQDERPAVPAYSYGNDTQVPVRFDVPFGQPETSESGANRIFWRLTAVARIPGIDYKASFDVPLKKAETSDAAWSPSPIAEPVRRAAPVRADDAIQRLSLRLQPLAEGGVELIFPPARALGTALFLVLFTVVWSGVCYILWTAAHVPILFAVVFTLFDVFLLLSLADMLLITHGIVLDRNRREAVVWKRVLSLPLRTHRIPFEEIADYQCERSGASGNTVFFRIVLVRKNGRPLTVGNHLKSWNDAERVARFLSDGG